MDLRDIQTMYDYNVWANRQILAASQRIGSDLFVKPTSHSFGSLRGTLVHTLGAELAWRMLCQHGTLEYFDKLQEAEFANIDVLTTAWDAEEQLMREYLGQLSDADMASYIRYEVDGGIKRERLLWHCLYHTINHGMQHRSEAAAILTSYNASPGDLDFTMFLNQRG